MKRLTKQMIANNNAIKFATQKELNMTSAPIYKVSKRLIRNWNDGQKHPSYMNPAYRPAQQYNKRMK